MDLEQIQAELKKRLNYPYKWGRKQSNSWDRQTNFIYKVSRFNQLLIETENYSRELTDYALNRWYNYWSAMAIESIFTSHENVVANKNKYDKLVDFKLNSIPFDHKTSVFPKGFGQSFEYAVRNKEELIKWLYENQSQQGRKHLKNRLFLVLCDSQGGNHWKIKAELYIMKEHIDTYVRDFREGNLTCLNYGAGEIYADIIWITK